MVNLKFLIYVLNITIYIKSIFADDVQINNVQIFSTGTKSSATWEVLGNADLIEHFLIYWGTGDNAENIQQSKGTRRFVKDHLDPNTEYRFCIHTKLINGNEQLPQCALTDTYYKDPTVPDLKIVPTDQTLNVSWSYDGPMEPVEYVYVKYSKYPDGMELSKTVDRHIQHYEIEELLPNTKYLVCIELMCFGSILSHRHCEYGVTQEGAAGECPPTYTKIGEKCYHIDTTSSWIKGRSKCEELSVTYGFLGDLAVFDNFGSDFNYVSDYMIQNNISKFWIGAFDIGHEGNWKWVNASPLDLRSSSWQCNTPENDSAKNCAIISKVEEKVVGTTLERIKLIDAPCDNEYTILCQLETMF